VAHLVGWGKCLVVEVGMAVRDEGAASGHKLKPSVAFVQAAGGIDIAIPVPSFLRAILPTRCLG
jgi:hypothetical protein